MNHKAQLGLQGVGRWKDGVGGLAAKRPGMPTETPKLYFTTLRGPPRISSFSLSDFSSMLELR